MSERRCGEEAVGIVSLRYGSIRRELPQPTAWVLLVVMVWALSAMVALPVSAETPAEALGSDLQQAQELVKAKRYDQAEKLYLAILESDTEADRRFGAQKGLTILYVSANKLPEAETAYRQLLSRFSDHKDLPQAVYNIGRTYGQVGKTDKAQQLYQHVMENWHDTEWAIHAQRDIIHFHLERGDEMGATDAVQELLTDFASHKDIAGTIYNLAKYYRSLRKPDVGFKLHEYNVEHYAEDRYGMWSQIEIIKSYIWDANDAGMDRAFSKLVGVFSQQPSLSKEVYQIGLACNKAGKADKARYFYRYVVEHWPESDPAVRSQVAILDAYAPPEADEAVEAVFDRLIETFWQQKTPAKEVYETGIRYRETRPAQARKVHQYNVERSSKEDPYAMWSQVEVIKSWIRDENESQAEAAYRKLLDIFSRQPTLAKEVCRVGDAYVSAGNYDKAARLYQYAQQNWTAHEQQLWAHVGFIRLQIARGDDATAWSAIGSLITDFKEHPELAKAMGGIGQQYYLRSFAYKAQGSGDRVKDSFVRTVTVLEKIVKEFPDSVDAAPPCLYAAGVCYQELGDHEKARGFFRQIVSRWPDYEYARQAKAMAESRVKDLQGPVTGLMSLNQEGR